ncbi:MAG: AI-2E family transporter [Oscillospiraceae bacterium]|nr:AI-2E family transporter [Oscillospiraceae bacterium]
MPVWGKKVLYVAAAMVGAWLAGRYLLPVALPFLLGTALALAAEPLVKAVSNRLPRGAAAGVGVAATLAGIAAIVSVIGAVAVRQLGRLAGAAPTLVNTARQGMVLVQDFFVNLSEQAPESLRPALQRTVLNFFDDGTVLLQQLSQYIPGIIGTTLTRVGDGALGLGTGILSAFLISARLPRLKQAVVQKIPASWEKTYLPNLRRLRKALGGWFKAQLKLAAVTWVIVTVGFVLLKIPYAPMWALVVALVDAVPILGTGTILLPWALVCLLQGQGLNCIGLLCTYGAAFVTRTVLEPRLVGQQLGLDPLATLVALYIGYRFWGILGMLLMPIVASAAVSLVVKKTDNL